jgi:hypothetical protein
MAIGFAISIKRWRHVGHAFLIFMFLFWIIPYSLIGGKWLRYTLALMPFVYMLAAVGVTTTIEALSSRFPTRKNARLAISAGLALLFIGLPAWTAVAHGPHYALYTNAIASDKTGYYFPHDEFYDDGLREAIKYVCDNAPRECDDGSRNAGRRSLLSIKLWPCGCKIPSDFIRAIQCKDGEWSNVRDRPARPHVF